MLSFKWDFLKSYNYFLSANTLEKYQWNYKLYTLMFIAGSFPVVITQKYEYSMGHDLFRFSQK